MGLRGILMSYLSRFWALIWGATGAFPLTGIVGLAVVIFGMYYWRAFAGLPKPSPRPRRLPPDSAGPSSSGAGPSSASPHQTSDLSHAKAVPQCAQLLRGVRRLTVSAPGVVVAQAAAEELSEEATLVPGAVEALKRCAENAELYLLTQVDDDVGEVVVRGALEHAGLVGQGKGQVPPHRLLFCGTLDGKASLVRQLEPDLHIDAQAATIEQLRRFIARLVYIGTLPAVGGSAPNVSDAASLVEALK